MAAASHRARSWSSSSTSSPSASVRAPRRASWRGMSASRPSASGSSGMSAQRIRRQADGLGAQLPAHQLVPAGRGVALVEDRYRTARTRASRSGSAASRGTAKGMPASRILRLARTRRCGIVVSETRKARAISGVCRPPTSRRVSATRASSASAGWQQVKISAQSVVGDGHGSSSSSAGHGAARARRPAPPPCRRARGAPQAVDRPVARRRGDPGGRARPARRRAASARVRRRRPPGPRPRPGRSRAARGPAPRPPVPRLAEQAVDLERGAAVQEAAVPAASLFSATSVPPASRAHLDGGAPEDGRHLLAQAIASSRSAQSTT